MHYVTIKEVAEKIGMDRSHARRFVLSLGIRPEKRRVSGSNGQLVLTVSPEQANKIIEARNAKGFGSKSIVVDNENGFFYVIQLVPDLDPRRIKLGFANNTKERLMQHRTAAPTAVIVKDWPCKRSWEKVAIDCVSQGAKHILNEVYESEDIDGIVEIADDFFSLMPDVNI